MKTNCGWAQFVDPDDNRVVARGCIYVFASDLPGPIQGPWEGEAELLRGHGSLTERDRPYWLLRFEHGPQLRWVQLRAIQQAWSPSGLHATARIESFDEEYPSVVSELGGE